MGMKWTYISLSHFLSIFSSCGFQQMHLSVKMASLLCFRSEQAECSWVWNHMNFRIFRIDLSISILFSTTIAQSNNINHGSQFDQIIQLRCFDIFSTFSVEFLTFNEIRSIQALSLKRFNINVALIFFSVKWLNIFNENFNFRCC